MRFTTFASATLAAFFVPVLATPLAKADAPVHERQLSSLTGLLGGLLDLPVVGSFLSDLGIELDSSSVNSVLGEVDSVATNILTNAGNGGTLNIAAEITTGLANLNTTFAGNDQATGAIGSLTNIVGLVEGLVEAAGKETATASGSIPIVGDILGEVGSVIGSLTGGKYAGASSSVIQSVLKGGLGNLTTLVDQLSAPGIVSSLTSVVGVVTKLGGNLVGKTVSGGFDVGGVLSSVLGFLKL
ncbi:hypothetical protein KVR01_008152 [Diaporthe batatas]|uniref:uncharacterized protein n=1 Tax=Diaporthe batatas TaxID=748121 RepID=UPI001D04A728|nr:uncharacterized protein KVR01_008152 [Diaporthe batatas]KAG8162387.1 hypothetical protein KVR01_008152 [Diaporthe batatas]